MVGGSAGMQTSKDKLSLSLALVMNGIFMATQLSVTSPL